MPVCRGPAHAVEAQTDGPAARIVRAEIFSAPGQSGPRLLLIEREREQTAESSGVSEVPHSSRASTTTMSGACDSAHDKG